jgi:RecA-family ATPase
MPRPSMGAAMTPATKRLPKRRGPSNKKPRNANRYRERNNRANGPEPEIRIKLKPFDAITLGTSRPYLIKKLIPRTGLTVIWGAPKSGKSFLAFHLAMHVAPGCDYRGRRVQQGPVVYCAFEGQGGIPARKEAFRLRYLTEHAEKVPFYLQDLTLDLVNQRGELIAEIQAMLGKTPPVLVELDTLNRSLRGSENSDQDMGAYINAADAIRETFECAVVIVHHCGVAGDRPRGHTSLTGAVDAQLAVKRDTEKNILVTV